MNTLGKEAGFLCVWMLHLAHRALQWPLTPEKWIMRLYNLWAYPITHAWEQSPMNICKANWLSFFQNLPSFRCLQINLTAARSSVLRNQRYTNQYHLMFCFTHPIFPVLLGMDIASLSWCFYTIYNKDGPDPWLWCSCVTKTPNFQYAALMAPGEPLLLPAPREPPDSAALQQWFWCIIFIYLKNNSTVEFCLSHLTFIILYFIVK